MNRKNDHIEYSLKQEFKDNDFDKIRFVHNLSSISFAEVDLKTAFCGFSLDYPVYINAMTGGSSEAKIINDKLSKLAAYFNIPIASGSLSSALKDESIIDSFRIIRDNFPKGIVMANIGADKSFVDCLRAIKILDADILQIHLNVVQEMIMPEGDRDFRKLVSNIKEILKKTSIEVIIKEVGFGMSYSTLQELKSMGIKTIDISGSGGTNFALIENSRREKEFKSLNNFGLSTVESLLDASKITSIDMLASGGIRNPMDVVKALALGAKAVGMSGYFLKLISNNSLEAAIEIFENFILELKTIMTVLGKRRIIDLQSAELIVTSDLESFMRQREIPLSKLKSRIQ